MKKVASNIDLAPDPELATIETSQLSSVTGGVKQEKVKTKQPEGPKQGGSSFNLTEHIGSDKDKKFKEAFYNAYNNNDTSKPGTGWGNK